MKKRFLLIGLALFGGIFLTAASSAEITSSSIVEESIISSEIESIEEENPSSEIVVETPETPEVPDVIYPCTVKINEMSYGDLIVDITEGNVGDIVTVYAKPYTFCRLISISVNGVDLICGEDGNYKFALVNGENVLNAVFEIDTEQMAVIAQLLADAKDGNWEAIFTIENLLNLIGWVITALSTSGLGIMLLKSKKIKTQTTTDVTSKVEKVIEDKTAESINKFLNDTFGPLMDKTAEKISGIDAVCKTLARCFILSQENTPESRLAIIEELTKLQKTEKELTEEVKRIINQEVLKNTDIQNQKRKAIAELEEVNNAITEAKTTTDTKSNSSSEGRY